MVGLGRRYKPLLYHISYQPSSPRCPWYLGSFVFLSAVRLDTWTRHWYKHIEVSPTKSDCIHTRINDITTTNKSKENNQHHPTTNKPTQGKLCHNRTIPLNQCHFPILNKNMVPWSMIVGCLCMPRWLCVLKQLHRPGLSVDSWSLSKPYDQYDAPRPIHRPGEKTSNPRNLRRREPGEVTVEDVFGWLI